MFAAMTTWCLALAIGQANPSETKRLDSIPSDAQIVARLRGLQSGRNDLVKMLEAMSPNIAAMAQPTIDAGLKHAVDRFGKSLSNAPILVAVRLPDPKAQGTPPNIAFLVQTDDYPGILKSLAGDDRTEKKPSGVDSFAGPGGAPMYTAKGTDFVIVGAQEDFVAEILKPKDGGIGKAISGDVRERLFEGDLGIFVNLTAIQKEYGAQIEQARAGMFKQMEQQSKGNPAGDFAKSMGDAIFSAFQNADGLALSFDFAPAGLILHGDVTLKEDSSARKSLKTAKTGDASGLSKLPANLSNFTYVRISPGGSDGLVRAGATLMLSKAAKDSDSYRKATTLMREAGARDGSVANVVNIEKPMSLGVSTFDDPRKGVEAMLADLRAVKEGKGLVKDVEIVPKTISHRGFEFHEVHVMLDLDEFAKLTAGNPAAAAMPKPPEKTSSWFGTDGKVVLNVAAKSWEEAKTRIDAYLDGKGTIGEVKGFQAARKLLPTQVGMIFLFGAQSLVGDFMKGLAMGMGKQLNLPKLPADPVFIGVSVSPADKGYHFRFVIPNDVGPIIEGALPALQGGGVQQ